MGPNGWATVALKRYPGGFYTPAAVPEDLSVSLGDAIRCVLERYVTHHLAALGIRGAVCFRKEGFVWQVDPFDWCMTFEDGRANIPPCRGVGTTRAAFEAGPLEKVLPGPGTRVTWPLPGSSFLLYFETCDPEHVLRMIRDGLAVRDVMTN